MPGKVFISCGQASKEEKSIANSIKSWLEDSARGYSAYIAVEIQSLDDINSAIVKELTSADYYIFIDFRREPLNGQWFQRQFRGSLFSHQELILAYYLGFDKVILLRERGVLLEGFLKYFQSNSVLFNKRNQILDLVKQEITKKGWSSSFSRNLTVGNIIQIATPIRYKDHTGERDVYIFECEINNNRKDKAAMNALAILKSIESPNGNISSPDTSFLKWANQTNGYSRTIFPLTNGRVCLFQIDCNALLSVFLQSMADLHPRSPIVTGQAGIYKFRYQVFAENFPLLEFQVLLNLTGTILTTTAAVV